MSRVRPNPSGVPVSRVVPRPGNELLRADDAAVTRRYRDIATELLRQMWSGALANAVVRATEAEGIAKFLRYAGRACRDYLAWQLLAGTLEGASFAGRFRGRAGTFSGPRDQHGRHVFVSSARPTLFARHRALYEGLARATERYFAGLAGHVERDREAAGWRAVNALGKGDIRAREVARRMTAAAKLFEAGRDDLTQHPDATLWNAQLAVDKAMLEVEMVLSDLGLPNAARLVAALNIRHTIIADRNGKPDPELHVRTHADEPIRRVRKATP